MTMPLSRVCALSVLLACGSLSGAGSLAVDPMAGSAPGDRATMVRRAAAVLAMQPGDAARVVGAEPIAFEARTGDREFSGELIVRARAGMAVPAAGRVAPLMAYRSELVEEYVVRVPAGMSEGELAGVLMATGDYELVMPNWTVFQVATTPNDPLYSSSWQHTRIQSALAWDIERGSSDVIVAVCDSGVRTTHADLSAALVPGYNSANRKAQADGGLIEDINGHGTFVAGCAAAIGNNSTGVVGVGWNFGIMPVRVTNNSDGTASIFALTDGARWAARNGAKAINVSYSGATAMGNNDAGRYVKDQGGLLFWAAGNDGAGIAGHVDEFVVVGSTTSGDNRSSFSNYGQALSIVAPGSGVRSTRINGGYGTGSGTSFASPIAAGVGAMIFSANPLLSPDDVQDVLYTSADDLGAPGRDDFFGHGRVNTFRAVTLARSYTPRSPLPLAEPFDSASWQGTLSAVTGAPALIADPDAPSGGSALLMPAGTALETVPLAGKSAVSSDYAVRLSVRTEGAEAGESLGVLYLNDADQWVTLFEAPASGDDTGYIVHEEPVPADFAHHGVRLRLVANGSDASDRWMVDDLSINTRTPAGAPFADGFDVGRLSSMRWTDVSGAGISQIGSNFLMNMADGATATTVAIPLVDLASFEQWVWFYVDTDGIVAGDTLRVEYTVSASGWQPLTTIDGGSLAGGLNGFEIPVPFSALASDSFRLRFTAATSGGAFVVDDINAGTSRLPDTNPGCSPADLAEPHGVLNFFDLSAYLALYNTQDPAADLAAPYGVFNFFDLSAYLAAYNAGCP